MRNRKFDAVMTLVSAGSSRGGVAKFAFFAHFPTTNVKAIALQFTSFLCDYFTTLPCRRSKSAKWKVRDDRREDTYLIH